MDLDEILLKQPDELSEEETSFLKKNEDKLSPENKEAYSSVLVEPADIKKEGEEKLEEEPKEEKKEKEDKEEPTSEEKEEVLEIKTKKDLDNYLEEKRKEWKSEGATKKEVEEKKEELVQIFKEGELPKDWNDYSTRLIKYLHDHPEKLAKSLIPSLQAEFQRITEEEKKVVDSYNKKYDTEYDALAKEGKLPARDTKEGQVIDAKLAQLSIEYNLPDYKAAYDLWVKIPEEFGGGYGVKTSKMSAQKSRAGQVSGSSKGVSSTKSSRPYKDTHTKSMDDFLENEL